MNNSELSGIVRLEDLPNEEIFIALDKEFLNRLNLRIRRFGIYKLAREIKVSNRILCHWLTEGTSIRLDVLLKVFDYFDYKKFYNKISYIKGKTGGCIVNPLLPFNFRNKSGVRLVASILGDGGLSNKKDIMYSNSNLVLIYQFIEDLNDIFGRIEPHLYKGKNVMVVWPPAFLRTVFNLFGINIGKKVVNNPKIPSFIYGLSSDCIFDFISKMIDDEGSINIKSKSISIVSVTEENHTVSNILVGIKELLLKEGVHSEIYAEEPYFSTRGMNRIKRRLQINGYYQLKKLHANLNIKNKRKQKKFEILLNSYIQIQYPRKNCMTTYLSAMEKIQKEKGFFTVADLAPIVDRGSGHVRNMIHKYNSLNVIKCIEPYNAGNIHTYAKYIIAKNENNC